MAAGIGFGLAGISQAEEDMLREAQTTEHLGKVAMQPFELRTKRAEAEHKELEVAGERRMEEIQRRRAAERATRPTQQLATSAGGNSAGDLAAAQLYEMAQDAIDAARPKLAGDIAIKASQIRQHEASATNSQANARLHTLQGEIQAANLLARHVNSDTVTDQASWDNAWAQLGVRAPGPYNPQQVKDIQRAAISEHEKLTREHQDLTRKETKRMHDAHIQDIIDRKPLIQARVDLDNARTARLGRDHGRGGTGEPKPADVKVATDLLDTDYFNIDPSEARTVGRDIAAEALDRVQRNPSLNYREAVKEVYLEQQAAGDFEIYGRKKPKEVTGGKTREKPLAVPVASGGGALVNKLIKDRWYSTPKGPLKWNGKAFASE